jgi:hypothetical protein
MPETPEMPEELPLADEAAAIGDATPSAPEGEAHPAVEAGEIAAEETAAPEISQFHPNEVATREETPVFEVHAPHEAVHSWKDVLVHIAIIVVGLLIALGLDEAAQYVHHRREVAEVREELRAEREVNKQLFERETATWRWEAAELENNLMVLAYLKEHPGTPDEKLPGSLAWFRDSAGYREAAWDAAQSSGVTSLMPQEEVEGYEHTYHELKAISDAEALMWESMINAFRYQLTDTRLSRLGPAQIAEITTLTQITFTKLWLEGEALEYTAIEFRDFPPSITVDELWRVLRLPSEREREQNPAYALTIERMRAAGFVLPAEFGAKH